jgi:hypothetical protein
LVDAHADLLMVVFALCMKYYVTTMSEIRIRQGMLQTPICEFEQPQTGNGIGFIGMVHIGDYAYYDSVAGYIRYREQTGSIVHYEGVRPTGPTSTETALPSPELEKGLLLMDSINALCYLMADANGNVRQKEALNYSEAWENHDMRLEELVRRLGKKSVERYIEIDKNIQDLRKDIDEKSLQMALQIVMRGAFRAMPLLSAYNAFRYPDEKRVIIDQRNDIALAAVDQSLVQSPSQAVTMLWGVGHLPGIKKGLQQRGYQQTSEYWLNAFSVAFSDLKK